MLDAVSGLSDTDLAAIADLERRVIAHDGSRLKLEWGALRGRSGDQVDDLLWRDDEKVLGFLGFYSFGPDLEFAGMVDPAVRRTGIATAMLAAATPIARDRGFTTALLVTPRATAAGKAFAAASGAGFHHSEHFLALGATPADAPIDPRVRLRPATTADTQEVRRILAAAFDEPERDLTIVADDPIERVIVIERDHTTVGVLRLAREGEAVGIYGFAVDPRLQGQGIGRDTLTRICREARADGVTVVTLEVAVDNDRALELYLSVGFEPQATEDYYAISLT
ncbi:MAG TPA: GNAT family N-acetyltransferase [Mycobacteriales bacterium]|nr:GNAT family N-acetyltransferase [Mycobacteriales bacterium]